MKTSIHFFIISRSVLLRMRNISDKICIENQNTHFVFNNLFYSENLEEYCRSGQATDDNIVALMLIACWIPKATNSHSENVILLFHCDSSLTRTLHDVTLHARCLPCIFTLGSACGDHRCWKCSSCIRRELVPLRDPA
jgi:hypothetical protein